MHALLALCLAASPAKFVDEPDELLQLSELSASQNQVLRALYPSGAGDAELIQARRFESGGEARVAVVVAYPPMAKQGRPRTTFAELAVLAPGLKVLSRLPYNEPSPTIQGGFAFAGMQWLDATHPVFALHVWTSPVPQWAEQRLLLASFDAEKGLTWVLDEPVQSAHLGEGDAQTPQAPGEVKLSPGGKSVVVAWKDRKAISCPWHEGRFVCPGSK